MDQNGNLKSPYDYKIKDYKDILRDKNLLQAKRGKIAVIGAGMSGLVAASLLKRAGHDITIFEAKHTVGGRVKTLRDQFTNGFYAEAGAMRIPSHHALTNLLIDEFELIKTDDGKNDGVLEFHNYNPDFADLIYINETQLTFAEYKRRPAAHNDILFNEVRDWLPDGGKRDWLTEEEKAKTADVLFGECVQEHIREEHGLPHFDIGMLLPKNKEFLSENQLYPIIRGFDKYSLRQFLGEKAKIKGKLLTKSAQNMICSMLSHEMQLSASMAAIIGQYIAFNAKGYKQIKHGMDRLPKAFLKNSNGDFGFIGLEQDIQFNSRVIEIKDDVGPRLRLLTRNTFTMDERPHDGFDRVIMSIPFAAIRHIQMERLTSAAKRRAIRQIHYVNACKILLEFSEKFWEDGISGRPPIKGGGHSITDLPIRNIYYPSPGQNENKNDNRGLLLASYTWGEDSLRWTSLKPDDRIRFALRDLARVHQIPELKHTCTGGMSHSWAEDEFTSGAFAHFERGELTDLFEDVWRPESKIHYAGEHTSTKHAWIEGAVESGIRVAKEVCDDLNRA